MPQVDADRPLIDDDQALKIVSAAVEAAGPAGQTEDDLRQILDWALHAVLDQAALKLISDGEMGAFIRDGEIPATAWSCSAPAASRAGRGW
jgi:hypothetical protein